MTDFSFSLDTNCEGDKVYMKHDIQTEYKLDFIFCKGSVVTFNVIIELMIKRNFIFQIDSNKYVRYLPSFWMYLKTFQHSRNIQFFIYVSAVLIPPESIEKMFYI